LIYEKFKDDFDFLFFVLDKKRAETADITKLSGVNFAVSNAIEGIGRDTFNSAAYWGSSGKLKSAMFITYDQGIALGPTLHEFCHNWGAFILTRYDMNGIDMDSNPSHPEYASHWGVSNAGGQLGGFKYLRVRNENPAEEPGKKLYEGATRNTNTTGPADGAYLNPFSIVANGGNSVPYSDIELYLMGMKSAQELSNSNFQLDIYTENTAGYPPHNVTPGGSTMHGAFYSNPDKIISYTIEDIISEEGPRVPDSTNSQKDFKVLTVMLTDESGEDNTSMIVRQMTWFAGDEDKTDVDIDSGLYNFAKATGGVGSLEIEGISESLKSESLAFENDNLADTSNGAYDDEQKKIVFYYKAGYIGKVTAGIKIKTDDAPVTISFAGTSDEIGVALASVPNIDIKATGIANIPANGSETIKVEINAGDIDNTIAGVKSVKINGVGIALIGQPVPSTAINYHADGHFQHGQVEKDHSIKLEPTYVFLENPQIYKYGNTLSTESTQLGGPLRAGDYVIGNGSGGIKVEKIYDPDSNTFWFESDGPVVVDPDYVKNNMAHLRVFADKLRADTATGPLIAGYDYSQPVGVSSIHLDRHYIVQLSPDSVTATVGESVSQAIPIVMEPTFNRDNTDVNLIFFNITEETVIPAPDLKTEFNGLTLEIENETVFVSGTATKAGTVQFHIGLSVNDKDDPLDTFYYPGAASLFTIAIAENASTPPPAPEVKPRPQPGAIDPPSAETVSQAQVTVNADLGIDADKVVAADTAILKTNQSVFAEDDGVRVYTAAAVSLNQPVSEGGAAVIGEVFLPLSGTSLANVDLPVPDVFDELTKLYSVNKYFQGKDARDGGVLDLLKIYGSDLFSYSKESGGVYLNATVVIVDGTAPQGDAEVTSPYNNPEYGVKLAKHEGGGNYLYIFDGVMDGSANDPIALVANVLNDEEADNSSGPNNNNTNNNASSDNGGGGCDTGGLGLLMLGMAALLSSTFPRKRS
jgi:hypothetical protein